MTKNGRVQVLLPKGWQATDAATAGNNKITGRCIAKNGYVLVLVEEKADFAEAKTAGDYASIILKLEEKNAEAKKIKNRSLSPPKSLTVHGYPAVQYELGATVDDLNLSYVKTFIALPTQFAQVMCWTTPSRLSECRGDFNAIAESVEEPPSHSSNSASPP